MKAAGFGGLVVASVVLYLVSQNSAGSERGIVEGDISFDVTPFDNQTTGEDIQMNITEISENGLNAIKQREGGFQQFKYPDAKGYSIGYGHFIKPGENYDAGITEEYGSYLLMMDVQIAIDAINSYVTVPLTQNQFDALVSFIYNIGVGAFKKSTLLRKLNSGDPTAVNEFSRWNISGGVVNSGLIARRVSETEQFTA